MVELFRKKFAKISLFEKEGEGRRSKKFQLLD
jgi:hypothetical protein